MTFISSPQPKIDIYGRSPKRKGPKTMASALAYRLGIPMRDRYGRMVNSHKNSREKKSIFYLPFFPEQAKHMEVPQIFADKAEESEKRRDAQFAMEIMLPLPRVMIEKQHIEVLFYLTQNLLGIGFCGFAILHQGPKGDNPHLHIVTALRKIDEPGEFCKKKERLFYPKSVRKQNFQNLRMMCQDAINKVFEDNGYEERVDFRSYQKRGVIRVATIHVCPYYQSEYRKKAEIYNDEAKKLNAEIDEIETYYKIKIEERKAEIAEEQTIKVEQSTMNPMEPEFPDTEDDEDVTEEFISLKGKDIKTRKAIPVDIGYSLGEEEYDFDEEESGKTQATFVNLEDEKGNKPSRSPETAYTTITEGGNNKQEQPATKPQQLSGTSIQSKKTNDKNTIFKTKPYSNRPFDMKYHIRRKTFSKPEISKKPSRKVQR